MTEEPLERLSERFSRIYTGALTDVLHKLGHSAQTLPPPIAPLRHGMRLAGPAFAVETQPGEGAADEVERAWEMLQAVPAGHVLILATGADDHSVIGDLAVALLKTNGCAGVVVNGGCRDVDFLVEIGLPVFCRFATPQDITHGRGDIVEWGQTITIGGVTVATGDYIVGDSDGAVVIPSAHLEEVLQDAEALVADEAVVRAALLRGCTPEEAYREASSRQH